MNQMIEFDRVRQREDEEIEIDLLDLFGYYMTKLKWIIGAFILGALIAGCVTHFMITPKYTASASMYMVSSSSGSVVDLSDLNIGTSLSEDYAQLIKTRPIVEGVAEELKLDYTYEELLQMINISVLNNTRILKIEATSTDKREAMNIANALASKAEVELPKLMDAPKPNIAERAIIPKHKSSPSLTKNTMIGALLALLAVLGFLTILYLMDDTFKSADDVEKHLGVMPLTVIPEGQIEGVKYVEGPKQKRKGRLFRRLRRKK